MTELHGLAPRYRRIFDSASPFLVTHRGNLSRLDLSPLGWEIAESARWDPSSLSSQGFVDRLDRLDSLAFGGQGMRMPRWVFYDCGSFPGIVFGFSLPGSALPPSLRDAFGVEEAARELMVPISMWVAIPCAESGAWFGHNLSSANGVGSDFRMAGLGTLTKALGIALTRLDTQYGATQWSSLSLGLHLTFGPLQLVSAYTPAHTHPRTFTYRVCPNEVSLKKCLQGEKVNTLWEGERSVDIEDDDELIVLQREIEAENGWDLVGVERSDRETRGLLNRRRPRTR